MEPESFGMCAYKFIAGRGAEYLHAIIAGTEEKRTENIDNQVYPNVKIPCLLAVSSINGPVTAVSIPSGEDEDCHNNIEQAYQGSADQCNKNSHAPPC